MSKKIFIVIALITVFVLGLMKIQSSSNSKQETELKQEINKIKELLNNSNVEEEKLNNYLDETVSGGDFAKVEKATKKYLKDVYINRKTMNALLNDEKISMMLSAENYINDGPMFESSKKYIDENIEATKNICDEYYSLYTTTKIDSYLNPNDELKKEATDLYYNDLIGSVSEIYDNQEIRNMIDERIKKVTYQKDVLNFLSDNLDKWYIDNDSINFNNDDTYDEYVVLLDQVKNS